MTIVLFLILTIQLGFDLSNSTISEFKILVESSGVYGEKIRELQVFKDILASSNASGTTEFSINSGNWDAYQVSMSELSQQQNASLAQQCKVNMNKASISQNSSDRKFWQTMYTVHRQLSKP